MCHAVRRNDILIRNLRVPIWRSGLTEGYKMWQCTVSLDMTSGSAFATDTVKHQQTYNTHEFALGTNRETAKMPITVCLVTVNMVDYQPSSCDRGRNSSPVCLQTAC